MDIRYKSLFNFDYNNILYNSIVDEEFRILVTFWRLSCHKLYIETGRYKIPKIPRESHFCKLCGTVEDEHHTLLVCNAHHGIRLKFANCLNLNSVTDLLNPDTEEKLNLVGKYLKEIEKNMNVLGMCQ